MMSDRFKSNLIIAIVVISALAATIGLMSLAHAQSGPNPNTPGFIVCSTASGSTQCGWNAVTSTTGLPVQIIGGGGGGLSVQDGAAFTVSQSNFTPSGCQYNTTPPQLGSGTQGTPACDQYRAFMVDVPLPATNANNMYNLLTAPEPLKALSAEPSQATTTLPVPAYADLVGKTVTSPYANRELQLRCGLTMTNVTAATTCTGMGAQGASVSIYITDLTITRNDAGTTAVTATLNDSATTLIDLPNNGGGGGISHTYNTPLKIAANTAFQVALSAGITSAHISAQGFTGY